MVSEENFPYRVIRLKSGEGERALPFSLKVCCPEQDHVSNRLLSVPPAGAYVALTLLGSSPSTVGVSGLQQDPDPAGAPQVTPVIPPPPPPPPLPPPQRITGPKPLQVWSSCSSPHSVDPVNNSHRGESRLN